MSDINIFDVDMDDVFAVPELSPECILAANRTAQYFDDGYPGWQLYSRIIRGDTVFDRQLAAWAIGTARQHTRTRKTNGQAVVAPRGRRNDWVAQAGVAALEFVIAGRYAESANETAERLGVHHTGYQKIRGQIAAMMLTGFRNYRMELHHQLYLVHREQRLSA